MLDTLKVYVISWSGRHQAAHDIAEGLFTKGVDVTVVYSDPNPNLKIDERLPSLRRPDSLMWADKLAACVESCNADVMLVIHADCESQDYFSLAEECAAAFCKHEDLSVWSPDIDGTYWSLDDTGIAKIPNSTLTAVASIDFLVFGLDQQAINRLKSVNTKYNLMGWGFDILVSCWAHKNNRLVCVDRSQKVRHSTGSGYDAKQARAEYRAFIKSNLDAIELRFFFWIESFVKMRKQVVRLKAANANRRN